MGLYTGKYNGGGGIQLSEKRSKELHEHVVKVTYEAIGKPNFWHRLLHYIFVKKPSFLHRLLHGIFGIFFKRKAINVSNEHFNIELQNRLTNPLSRNITSQRPKIKPAPQKPMLKNAIIARDLLKELSESVKDLEAVNKTL